MLESSNATSTLGVWVFQTQTSFVLVLRATAAQAILFVALLLVPRIPTNRARNLRLQQLFPFATILAWFALLLSAMASAIPQAFLSIRVVCGPSTPEVNFAIGQIFAFLEFSRAYVDVTGVLAMFTGIWLAAVINTGPLYHRGLLLRLFIAVFVPLAVFFADVGAIPLLDPVVGPCVSLSGSGTIETLPSWWAFVTAPILFVFMALGLIVLRKPKKRVGIETSTP